MNQPAPEVIGTFFRELDLPYNLMSMGSWTHTQSFSLQDLGGPDYLVTDTGPAHP